MQFVITFYKSSHCRCSLKKGVLRNFAKFTIFKNKFSAQHIQRTASGFKLSKHIFDKGLHILFVIIFSCARHDSKT